MRDYICSRKGCGYTQLPGGNRLQLTVMPTAFCEGRCPFCVAAAGRNDKSRLELAKLERLLQEDELRRILRGVSISGGEPFTDVGLLNEILEMVFDLCGQDTEVAINTNGCGISELGRLKKFSLLDAVHISRHHYRDDRNAAYFGCPVPTKQDLKEMMDSVAVYDRDVFVLNCMLLRDGIGTAGEVRRYFEHAVEIGIKKAALITVMPVNAYAKARRISYRKVLWPEDGTLLYTQDFQDYDHCFCQDGIYVSANGSLLSFYGRETSPLPGSYVRGLVFGPDGCLRTGFGGEVLWKT